MRRTYRSKKDTTGVLDPKEMLQLDEKSSMFDAFYIQNIKQVKREMSCMGSGNQYSSKSRNRVRKKKLVKKVIKDPDPSFEPSNQSTCLTPDKSIHVNKEMDLFDQLLNSSSTNNKSKDNLFVRFPTKNIYTYGRKRIAEARKNNITTSSSSCSDSDKENSREKVNESDDILKVRLTIEKEKPSSGNQNDSINNLSLFDKIKQCENSPNVNRKRPTYSHRLTKNLPNRLSNSPLCSTPVNQKYRGRSIYKLSPINFGTFNDSNNENNSNEPDYNKVETSAQSPIEVTQVRLNPVTEENTQNSNIHEMSTEEQFLGFSDTSKEYMPKKSIILQCSTIQKKSKSNSPVDTLLHYATMSSVDSKFSIEISEQEPFLGFTKVSLESKGSNDSVFETTIVDKVDNERKTVVPNDLTQYSSVSDENESHYDTCDSDDLEEKQPVVVLDKLNESVFDKYILYKMDLSNITQDVNTNCLNMSLEKEPIVVLDKFNDSVLDKYNMYKMDLTTSITEDINSDRNDVFTVNPEEKEPVVVLDKFSDSVLDKYDMYKMDLTASITEDLNTENDVSIVNSEEKEPIVVLEKFSDSVLDKYNMCKADITNTEDMNTDSDDLSLLSCETETNNDNDSDPNYSGLTVESDESSVFETTVNFVTTRRRNDQTNAIVELDYSNSSGSLDNTIVDANYKTDATNTETNTNNSELNKLSNKEDILNEKAEDNSKVKIKRYSRVDPKNTIKDGKPPRDPRLSIEEPKQGIVLLPGKKWERSLSIYRRMSTISDFENSIIEDSNKGRMYRQSIIDTMEMQDIGPLQQNESLCRRRSTFIAHNPYRNTVRIVKEPYASSVSLHSTIIGDVSGFLEDCDDTLIELSKLSIAEDHEVTVLENIDVPERITSAKDYVLRRCNQSKPLRFDECYPDNVLKNCHKIGEGVYGEVFLWKSRDGSVRVMKVIPIAGTTKVNGEHQKDYNEIISEIVIAMELSALRNPISDVEKHLDVGADCAAYDLRDIANATDVFNKVLGVKCVYGNYPSRLLDLWDLYDESKGSENDNPAVLPDNQEYIVLELANAGQDLEGYQFNNAEQAFALFFQVAFGLAVGEEAFQFEHRDLHWGNVLIAATDEKFATFILRGRVHRLPRCGVVATVIDYSLSRLSLPLEGEERVSLFNDLSADDGLFDAVGDYQFDVYRHMKDKLGNNWRNYEPYTNILWLHYIVDKMITALRYKRTNTKIHKHYISKLKSIKNVILDYKSATQFVLEFNEC